MGSAQSKQQLPRIKILNSSEATHRLSEPDNYFYACMACTANKQAMQIIEPVGAPDWALRLHEIKLPTWAPKQLEVAFFREGMPHTRGTPNTIWLPIHLPNFEQTFLHECVHICQRIQPYIWTKIYAEIFDAHPNTDIPSELNGRLRLNPDTYGWPHFTYWNRWTPVLTFKRSDAPSLNQVRLLFLKVGGGWQSTAPQDWMAKIGIDSATSCEHPNELTAYLLTEPSFSNIPIRAKLIAAINRYIG